MHWMWALHMLERCRMRFRRSMKRSVRLFVLLTIVALLLLLSIAMFDPTVDEVDADYIDVEDIAHELENPTRPTHHDMAGMQMQIKRGRESMLLHAKDLLSLLQRFSDEITIAATNARPGEVVRPVEKTLTTPESVLSEYYGTELLRLNNLHEKDLDAGYAENVVHSDTYWSPSHVTRRGYGLEGSIFVGVTHSQEASSSSDVETACAATVRSLYEAARWPLAVFTGVVDVTLLTTPTPRDTTASTASSKNTESQSPEETPAWTSTPPPPSVCVPRAYLLPSCAERASFCPTDNIFVRRVRVGPTSAGTVGAAGNARRRRMHPLFSSVAAQRYATLALYRGETYVMFITAGLQLVFKWDVLTRILWLQLPSRHAVLSQPPVPISRQAVRVAWNAVVVKHVEGVIATTKLFSNGTAEQTHRSKLSEEKLGNGVDRWLESIQWALNLEAVQLQLARDEAAGSGGKEHTDTEKDTGMREEDVVSYIFHHDAAVFRHAKEQAPMTGGATPREEGRTPGAASRRDIQLYWLRQFYESLREALMKEVVERNTTSCLSGVQMKGLKSRQYAESLFRLHATRVRRLSHAMQDPRYMRPSPFHACGGKGESACPGPSEAKNMCHSDVMLPYLRQAWVTTDFLFARAETFVNLPREGVDGYGGPTNADTVRLDPYLSFVGADEEAVLLSARLWTHGWDLFSATEPIAFTVAQPRTEAASEADTYTLSPTLQRLREQSVTRLRHILFGKNGAAGTSPNVEAAALRDVEHYGLGERRSKEQLFYFSGLQEATRREGLVESDADAQNAEESNCPVFFCRSQQS
ncbi:hypothetical protein TraAM80_03323 [Trypanosoma rangeli]|uniref:Uncharacterized protein n=1 Tax=Trypanosoma rangeli TaxID=5698 RepID=A0A422NPG6_TRYRA|nr:uncharacterized protein TraAM80_03323 [Trypanosoma rangeli]RNF07355.1 hypothetical protein TraAM80_03323 [Trypanosoma rangeli]|eukprot:RNF07355.1 hypothetical protein TraAM80_03323 [Trypanosoma rangeli]